MSKLVRARILFNGRPVWGTVTEDRIEVPEGVSVPFDQAAFLPPCEPTKIICVHLNYDSRRLEFRVPQPERTPSYFLKPPSSLNVHKGLLVRPRGCKYLNYEGEVGVVIGREMRAVSRHEAEDGVLGYAPANDVGCHDFRGTDRGSMLRVKGADGFCPIGPVLVSGINVYAETLRTYINGNIVQETPIADMSFDIGYMLADLSRYMTLMPGDLLLSGTPENSRPMQLGDTVEVEVTGVGRLTNTVVEAEREALDLGYPPTESPETVQIALGGDYLRQRDAAKS